MGPGRYDGLWGSHGGLSGGSYGTGGVLARLDTPPIPPQKKALLALKKQQSSAGQSNQGGIKRCEKGPCGEGWMPGSPGGVSWMLGCPMSPPPTPRSPWGRGGLPTRCLGPLGGGLPGGVPCVLPPTPGSPWGGGSSRSLTPPPSCRGPRGEGGVAPFGGLTTPHPGFTPPSHVGPAPCGHGHSHRAGEAAGEVRGHQRHQG